MAWLELTADIAKPLAGACEEALENLGALAVSLFDAGDDPLLEPLPGTTPLWQKVKMVGLFPKETSIAHITEQLKAQFPSIGFTHQILEDQDWTRSWLEHYHPMQFGERLWIMPHEYPQPPNLADDAVILHLDPGLAFGTGTHPTTALCLHWLAQQNLLNQTVIDYGCGSGILGIAALLLGAKQVIAVDYDPQALQATTDNAQRNHIDINTITPVLPKDTPKQAVELIVANILANPLIELAPTLSELCQSGGQIILSGLLTSQTASVQAAYEPWFSFEAPQTQEDWVLLVARRN